MDNIAKQRAKAKNELLKNLNPILKDYMKNKKVRMMTRKTSFYLMKA